MASGKVRLDITAILVVLALALSGILTVREALAGFGDPVVLLVAGLLVIGEGLTRTGVAYSIGAWLIRTAGNNETRILILMMLFLKILMKDSALPSIKMYRDRIPIIWQMKLGYLF